MEEKVNYFKISEEKLVKIFNTITKFPYEQVADLINEMQSAFTLIKNEADEPVDGIKAPQMSVVPEQPDDKIESKSDEGE